MRGNLRVLLFFTRGLYARPLRVAFTRGLRPRPEKTSIPSNTPSTYNIERNTPKIDLSWL
jgi:hypothetical protein